MHLMNFLFNSYHHPLPFLHNVCHCCYFTHISVIICFASFSSNRLDDNLYERRDYYIFVNVCIPNSILAECLSDSRHSGNSYSMSDSVNLGSLHNTDCTEEVGGHAFPVILICMTLLFLPVVLDQPEVDGHWNDKWLHWISYCFPLIVHWKNIGQRHWLVIDYRYVFHKEIKSKKGLKLKL